MPPLARITGAGVGQVINPNNVAVSETSTGYKAEVTPPTGTTAKELKDMLPGAAGDMLKNALNSAYADMQLTAVTMCVAASGAACAMPPPTPPPPPLPPGATTEMVSAKEVTLVLKAVGTVEEYKAKAESVKESLRWELYCFLPTCTLTDTVESTVEASNGVILTVVATDTAVVVTDTGTRSEVETSAVLWQAKTLDAMSSVLDLTIEDSDIEAVAVQVQVTRLAPSPPPTSPDICTVQDCERNLAEGRAEYQQAVAAGRKKEEDGMCVFGGMLFAAISGSECTGPDCWTMSHDYTDCNCGIDTASFAETSDCPDLHARMEREVCDKLRACAGLPPRDSGSGDSGPGLAIGLALGGCLLVAMLGAAVFVWHRKRRTQPPQSSASTAAPQQVEVTLTQPESKAAAPESLAALLAACGLEHHEETFKAEGYTLDTLLSSMAQGKEAVKSDLRELKLTLGECRKLINHLGASTSETMQASEAARALRASHPQTCAEACAKRSHRPSCAGACAEQQGSALPAPNLSLDVEGGNYSKQFNVPAHMPPDTTPQMRAAPPASQPAARKRFSGLLPDHMPPES